MAPTTQPPTGVTLCTQCNATFMAPNVLQFAADVATKIRTNHIPFEPEKQEIAEILGGAEKKLIEHEEEIQRLRRATEDLEGQRDALQKVVEGYRGLQAPIRRLPTETLHEIFSLAEWDSTRSSFFTKDDPCPLGLSPLNLVRVCSRWRSIVLQSKQLWTSVDVCMVDDPLSYPKEISCGARALEMYLERSGDLPLSIELTANFAQIYDGHPYLPILAKHSHRWHHATMSVPPEYYSEHSALASIRGNLPNLQSLEFISVEDTGNVFALCPKLNQIEFLYYFDVAVNIPWDQITTVRTRDESCDDGARDHLQILRLCPRITEFHMETEYIHDIPYPDTSSNLQFMDIIAEEWSRDESVPGLLDALTLPRLLSFEIEIKERGASKLWRSQSLSSLFRRSSCPLEFLSLRYTPITDTELIEVLRLLPSIIGFSLAEDSGKVVTTALLNSLTYIPSDSFDSESSVRADLPVPLLPKMECLRLALHSDVPMDDTLLMDMLQSRWQPEVPGIAKSSGVTCLKTLYLDTRTTARFHSRSALRLDHLRAEGLEILN